MKNYTIVLTSLIFLLLSLSAQAQWERNLSFQSKNFYAFTASFEDTKTGMASCLGIGTIRFSSLTDSGGIILTIDSATNWERSLVLADVAFIEISNTSPGVYYSCANYKSLHGIFAKTFNLGQSWDTTHFDNRALSLSFPSDSVGYLLTDSSRLYRTIDSGNTWQQVSSLPYTAMVYDVQFINDSTGFLIPSGDTLYKTIDSGSSWTKYIFPRGGIQDISFVKGTNTAYSLLLVGFDSAYVYKSTDQGSNWNRVGMFSFFNPPYPITLEFPTVDTGYVGGQYMIYKTVDGGNTWFAQKDNTNAIFHDYISDIECLSADTCFALGFNIYYRTYNGGDTLNTVGINNYSREINGNLSVYPNPINEYFYVAYNGKDQLQFELFNLMGQKVETGVQKEENRYRFSTRHLPEGIYFLKTSDGKRKEVFKLVKE